METLAVTAFAQNCSILWCDQTLEGAVIDPGGDVPQILAVAARHRVVIKQLLITHGHVDHCAAAARLAGQLDIPIVGPHPADQFWIDALPQAAASYGFQPAQSFTTDRRWLHDGDTVQVGHETLQVRHCRSHAGPRGVSCAIYSAGVCWRRIVRRLRGSHRFSTG